LKKQEKCEKFSETNLRENDSSSAAKGKPFNSPVIKKAISLNPGSIRKVISEIRVCPSTGIPFQMVL
jgi:hypothetical protein